MSEVLQNLETARRILRLPPTDDFHQLSLDIAARVDAMNRIDHAAFHIELGRLTQERSSREPGEKYATTTRTLIVVAIFLVIMIAISTYVILDRRTWKIIKLLIGAFEVVWVVTLLQAIRRIIRRARTGNDFDDNP